MTSVTELPLDRLELPFQLYNPEDFPSARLFVSDFDGTQGHTFESPPDVIGVNQAYNLAIQRTLGGRALQFYQETGGHQNRTPTEIVEELMPYANMDVLSSAVALIDRTLKMPPSSELEARIVNLREATDIETKKTETIGVATELIVATKLAILLHQVGRKISPAEYWPQPVDGFIDFWNQTQDARQSGERIDTAVISAGHESFIRKVYEMWEIPMPDIVVTDDTIRPLHLNMPADEQAKPAPLPMKLIHINWLHRYCLPPELLDDQSETDSISSRTIYVGDDLKKDGGLARNTNSHFVHIDKLHPTESWRQVAQKLKIGEFAAQESLHDQ